MKNMISIVAEINFCTLLPRQFNSVLMSVNMVFYRFWLPRKESFLDILNNEEIESGHKFKRKSKFHKL